MISELSILIPCYNSRCTAMVRLLQGQCAKVEQPFRYEIVVADDGSTDADVVRDNEAVNTLPCCHYVRKPSNTGSAATRNYLAQHSSYPWLLFLDCDMTVPDDHFIARYLQHTDYDVVNGGISIGQGSDSCLRYLYEKRAESRHAVDKRQLAGFHEFRSTNFLIRRDLMLCTPFDERFTRSGYEDVLFGKTLSEQGATILHTDNPLVLDDFENNADYMLKCERNWRTLYQFRNELQGYSRLLTLVQRLSWLRPLIVLLHRLIAPAERRQLTGSRPSLFVFNLYRTGYFASLF